MTDTELENFLSPFSEDAPSGPSLEYDEAFDRLVKALEGKPGVQYGDHEQPPEPPDWRTVRELATDLGRRTRDLRLAVWLARSGARTSGLPAYLDGLRIVDGLLASHWPTVHPATDWIDEKDATARVNAIASLTSLQGLDDLRAASVTGRTGDPTVRDVELAVGIERPYAGEAAPSKEALVGGLRRLASNDAEMVGRFVAAANLVQAIAARLDALVGSEASVDLGPLAKVVGALATVAALLGSDAPVVVAGGVPAGPRPAAASATSDAIVVREDAIRALDRVCEWIERNEPSNPASLLIRRAQRLMRKNFLEIIRDLAPDTLGQIERIAGIETS